MKDRIRRAGGGRKLKEDKDPQLSRALHKCIAAHTAGCPIAGVKWTYLTLSELRIKLKQAGHEAHEQVIKRLLCESGFGRRGLRKSKIMQNDIAGRDEQFRIITKLRDYYLSRGYTVLSMDVKKKEELGRFHRKGKVWSDGTIGCYDHDFNSFSSGRVTPHGVYDLGRNEGFITLGHGPDTAEFNVACLRQYWNQQGRHNYKRGSPLLLLLDGGDSNGSRNRLFKQELQDWVDEYGLNIRIAHYPPYCSKYNPIEHRLFPAVTRAWCGVMLDSKQTMLDLIRNRLNYLSSELKVGVSILEPTFEKGVKVFDDFLDYCKVLHDDINPKWNYRILAMA